MGEEAIDMQEPSALFICLFVCLSTCLFVYLYVCIVVCLSVYNVCLEGWLSDGLGSH